ncbi:MAG: hypothetical protein QF747_02925, partial [Patescibacteria group bacterium]|nr:hypothetical protein [Patescibacteria group bacterium]
SAHLADRDMPYEKKEKYEVIKKFNNRNHPEYGRNPMPENQYDILFLKILNNLGISGIKNNTDLEQFKRYTKKDLKLSEVDNITIK